MKPLSLQVSHIQATVVVTADTSDCRNPIIHVRDADLPRRHPRASEQRDTGRRPAGKSARLSSGQDCGRGIELL